LPLPDTTQKCWPLYWDIQCEINTDKNEIKETLKKNEWDDVKKIK